MARLCRFEQIVTALQILQSRLDGGDGDLVNVHKHGVQRPIEGQLERQSVGVVARESQ